MPSGLFQPIAKKQWATVAVTNSHCCIYISKINVWDLCMYEYVKGQLIQFLGYSLGENKVWDLAPWEFSFVIGLSFNVPVKKKKK